MPLAESPASAVCFLQYLLRKLPGEVLEKFQIFSDPTAADKKQAWRKQKGSLGRSK